MIIYFHIDELARDAVVASAMKHELKKIGGKLIYGTRFTTCYVLRHFDVFDAIILPSLPHYMDAFPDKDSLPDNVFIVQTEAIGQATGTLRRLNGKYFGHEPDKCEPWHKSVAAFLLWGYAHLNPFREYYPDYLQKCRVVGHPRLSVSCKPRVKKKKMDKPVVGFVSRFTLLSPFDERTPFESAITSMKFGKEIFPLYENSPERDVEDLFYTEVIDFRVMYQIMASLDPDKFHLTVRPHPRENRTGWQRLAEKLNLNVSVSQWDEPFGHWLERVDIIVTPPSTGLYDIYFHQKSAIVIDKIVPSRREHVLTESDDNNQILEGACRPRTVPEALDLINSGSVPFDKEIISQRLLEQVAEDIAGNSIRNILEAIPDYLSAKKKGVRRRLNLCLYRIVCFVLLHMKYLKARIQGRVEQGASFDLTLMRSRWIDRLTRT